jgi:hypothetical protein
MRFSSIAAASLASLVVVGWFLWPFPFAVDHPVRSAFAAIRAVALMLVVLGATNAAACYIPAARLLFVRCLLGFVIAFSIVVGISLALLLTSAPDDSRVDLRSLIVPSTADAFWCALALGVYYCLRVPSAAKEP